VLSVLPDDVLHAVLEVGVGQQVVLADIHVADIHVADAGLGQGEREGLPGLPADVEVLPHVQGSDAAPLQHLRQEPQLQIQHALRV